MSKGEKMRDSVLHVVVWMVQLGFPSMPKGEIVGIDVNMVV